MSDVISYLTPDSDALEIRARSERPTTAMILRSSGDELVSLIGCALIAASRSPAHVDAVARLAHRFLAGSQLAAVSPDELDAQIRSLLAFDKIPAGDAVIAVGLRTPPPPDSVQACRARISRIWNDLDRRGLICFLSWELAEGSGPASRLWMRAIVQIRGASPRDVHASSWTQNCDHARANAMHWAKRNGVVLVDAEPATADEAW